jgi:hypothetical protein
MLDTQLAPGDLVRPHFASPRAHAAPWNTGEAGELLELEPRPYATGIRIAIVREPNGSVCAMNAAALVRV